MCINPYIAYAKYNDKGYIDTKLSFKKENDNDIEIKVPCRNCIICQAKRRAELSALMMMENETSYERGTFITLTYNDNNIPINKYGKPTLNQQDITQFIRTLKQKCKRHGLKSNWKYIIAQEYGEKTHRPHYHLVIFDFDIYKIEKPTIYGNNHMSSDFIREAWGKGFDETYTCNSAMCRYTAGYSVKKLIKYNGQYLNEQKKARKQRRQEFLDFFYEEINKIIPYYMEINQKDLSYTPKKAIQEIIKNNDLNCKWMTEDRLIMDMDYPIGKCDIYKGTYIQAEKVRSSNGLGLDFWNKNIKEFYKGYIVLDPFELKKTTIPQKFMNLLKEQDFEAWENLKIQKMQNSKEWNKEEQQRIENKIKKLNILTDRKLDTEDFDIINEKDYKFTERE